MRDVQAAAVPANPYEGEATGTTSMLHSCLLTILCDSQMLLVVLKAKGPVDRPVVGDGDTAPLAVVVVGVEKEAWSWRVKRHPFSRRSSERWACSWWLRAAHSARVHADSRFM